MAIEEDVRALLLAQAGIVALVGDRVWPALVPDSSDLPALGYFRVDTRRVYSHEGRSGLARPRFQLDCYAGTYAQVAALAAAVRAALDGWRAFAGGGAAFVENEMDATWLAGTGRFRRLIDVVIWHGEE